MDVSSGETPKKTGKGPLIRGAVLDQESNAKEFKQLSEELDASKHDDQSLWESAEIMLAKQLEKHGVMVGPPSSLSI